MMKFTGKGWRKWVDLYVRQSVTMHLFTGAATDPQNLTEIAGANYAPVRLLGAGWTFSEVPGMVTASYPEVTWRFDGTIEEAVTGYFVRDADGDVIYWDDVYADEPFRVRARRRLGLEPVIQVATA